MNVKALKDMLKSDMAGKAIGLVASYCVKHQKTDALKKFQEFGASIASLFTESELNELQEEFDTLTQQQTEMYADVFEKTYSQKELGEFIQQSNGQSF